MSIRVAVNHKTHYHYDRQVNLSPHIFRLRPAPHCRTPIEAYSLSLKPQEHFINWQQDPFSNYLARVVFPEPTDELYVEVDLIADLTVINPFDFFVDESARDFPFRYDAQDDKDLVPYLEKKEEGPTLQKWMSGINLSKRPVIDFLVDLNQRLNNDITYSVRMEPGVQSCEVTLLRANGSCRDSSWLLVNILRRLGLAARFVSGYLIQLTADQKALDGPSGPTADFTDLHAWAEVFLPGAGWIGMDPTSGLFAGEGHIPLACTPDPISAAPVTGSTDSCKVLDFQHSNSVKRIQEDPRVTRPYTKEQWASINLLGETVDAAIAEADIRLTMGGEPTFVSIDNMDDEEWNIAADGSHKRQLAGKLIRRLHERFAQGGIRYCGQGKWYPGEELPRWRMACYWRSDGLALWQDPDLLADEDKDYGFGLSEAHEFLSLLSKYLKVDPACIKPAYEDIFYFLWTESKLPNNVNPLKTDLKDSLERKKLAALLDRGLGEAAGYVLPLRWNDPVQSWESCPWVFRRDQMMLIPGDSALGLRLPLQSLPWIAESEREPVIQQDPLEERQPLPDYSKKSKSLDLSSSGTAAIPAQNVIENKIRTAVCIEPRQGRLYIFMPPVSHLEHYLDLLSRVELTAASLAMPVVIEGYEPPHDPRLQEILVTPDPGVIEVNIHPSNDWHELVETTKALYDEARQVRLGTEKYMLDGHHTGTGGGNHVTLGGATPADSPFLRRPDLLRSMITYWQHHPGLSYLFSGMFIGPTSQAPRVDEGREEQLYELEIAFEQLPRSGEPVQPWLVDRVLRNLLVDITGNTHRSEFCIDKLYNPNSANGRLGLVEIRAFDMPPHAQMSVCQMLLVRSLLAWFWQRPYAQKLVRWGTELHDRYLLPYYVESDLKEVVDDLAGAGFPFQVDWLDPFFEFRFPRFGTARVRNIELELRMAIEPWNVLGEEVSSFGTSRYVDSSVERLQIKVGSLNADRYVITCNGRKLPLHGTDVNGEYVAGVRYQAWQPPSSLHPTLAVHAPLVFDVIDTWNRRSVGGCTYHVTHPGGRHYDDFPVNANVAESRRISRFWEHGHTPVEGSTVRHATKMRGKWTFSPQGSGLAPRELPPEERNPEYPTTLDLRR